jgi:NTP pyrophosphatase (non-canonical NTP hydrolase)
VNDLRKAIEAFIEGRDWEQFHSPKHLAMALSVEVAEVVEHFQWLTEEQSRNLPPEKLRRKESDASKRVGSSSESSQ